MKIAYIFFGQVKNFDDRQFYSIQQNILNQLNDHDIDFFLTTSIKGSYLNIRNKETEDTKKYIDYKSINKFFNFKEYFYDNSSFYPEKEISDLAKNLLSFGESWKEGSPLDSTINSLKQLYGLNYFYNHFSKNIDNYDYFILSRSDLYHNSPIDLNFFNENKDIWIPFWKILPQIHYGNFGGLNDRFAIIKTKKALESYCTRYNKILKSPQAYHAERYLKQIFDSENIKYGKINNFLFEMMRAGGVISDLVGTSKDENMNKNLNKISKCFYINLDRREDRRNHFITKNPFFAQRFSAIDSKSVKLNEEIKKLFPKTWNSRKKSEICCALSHYRLWKQLTQDNSSENYLILEDDTVFKDKFTYYWNELFSKFIPKDYNLIYLGGCQPWNKPRYKDVLENYNKYFCNVKKNDFFTKNDNFWHMNANSYILSKNAASLLCQWVDQNGMDEALDNFMQKFFIKNNFFSKPESIYHLSPLMSYQLHEEDDNINIDKNSDIRHDTSTFQSDHNNKISVIIPTIWASLQETSKSLIDLDRTEEVGEILIINNNPEKTPKWISKISKVKLINNSKRHFFNYSVNQGIKIATHNICCIYNDDITCDQRIFNFILTELNKEKDGCAFISPNFININQYTKGNLIKLKDQPKKWHGSGMLMFVNKNNFIDIPNELVHHFGDTFIFESNKSRNLNNYLIEGFPISTPGSASTDSVAQEIIDKDWDTHHKVFNNISKYLTNQVRVLYLDENLFEEDFIEELFKDFSVYKIKNYDISKPAKNSVIIYSDISAKDINIYPKKYHKSILKRRSELKQFFDKCDNCILVHLSDEHCHADIDHYKNFKHVFRQYYRTDAAANNVTFIPLGYKKGFCNE